MHKIQMFYISVDQHCNVIFGIAVARQFHMQRCSTACGLGWSQMMFQTISSNTGFSFSDELWYTRKKIFNTHIIQHRCWLITIWRQGTSVYNLPMHICQYLGLAVQEKLECQSPNIRIEPHYSLLLPNKSSPHFAEYVKMCQPNKIQLTAKPLK